MRKNIHLLMHFRPGNHFDVAGSNFLNLPAVQVQGDNVRFANNRTTAHPGAGPPTRALPSEDFISTIDGIGFHVFSNQWEGLPSGTGAATLTGSNFVVENNIVFAAGSPVLGFTGTANTSVFRRNTFLNMSGPQAITMTGSGNYIAPIIGTSAAPGNTDPNRNLVIDPVAP